MTAVALFTFGVVAQAQASCDVEYEKFLMESEGPRPEGSSKATFCAKLEVIAAHNAQNARWEMGINKFTDMEDVSAYLGAVLEDENASEVNVTELEVTDLALASSSKDWRSKMPSVKDQGRCGSCWVFSATAVIDFFSGKPHSEQQGGDCTASNLCNGGNPYTVLQYFAGGHKQAYTSDQPYKGTAGRCHSASHGATISSAHRVSGHSSILQQVNQQVVSVDFRLAHKNSPFMSYRHGVYDSDCGTGSGHAVAIVGYQSDYWIIRNSWGSGWGENGYFYFKKGKNLCNMESSGYFAKASGSSELIV